MRHTATIKRLMVCLLLVIASGSLAQAQSFDRGAMLDDLVRETILPLHETLAQEAATLDNAAQTFYNNPSEDTLSDFRDAWKATSIAFEQVEVYGFRRVMLYVTQLDREPNISFIENTIDEQEPGTMIERFAQNLGSAVKGLPALEYLIFSENALETLTETAKRREYAAALASDIHRVSDELVEVWTADNAGYADRFIRADDEPSSVRSAVSLLANELIAKTETIAQMQLGLPLGYQHGGAVQPEAVEAPYSQTSLAKIRANLEGIRIAFNGLEPDDTLSLADYLDFLGAEYDGKLMSDVINAQIDTAIEAVNSIEQPLQEALVNDPEGVERAYSVVVDLLRLIKVDMANQLGITVTFSDNDGD